MFSRQSSADMQILPPTRAPLIVIEEPSRAVQQPQVDDSADDMSPASALQRSIQNSDEMSAALTQFRNRRNFESKAETVSGDFEKVLEEDVLPKAQQIVAAVKVGDRPVEWLLQMARGLFADDSDLVLVLRELLRRKELPVAARQRLEKMLQTVIEQAPPQRLKAGINCALKARLFGKKLGLGAGIMRETYRSFLEAEDGPVDCYEDWVTLYGHQHRQTVLAFIEAALLTDIDALDPSCSRSEFGELLVRLTQLKHLRSADEAFIKHLLANELIRRYECQEPDLLVFLLGVLRYPDELDQLLSGTFGQSLLLASHAERSMALQLMRQVCLRLPPGLFPDTEALQRLAERFTHLADIAYAHETIERRNASDS
jgi:type III secretion system YopN/LcrE/InvE/MxiC family regulator